MKKRVKKPKVGRPPTKRGAYNPHPARQLGRVSDEDWKTLKQAAKDAGLTFTEWAVSSLKGVVAAQNFIRMHESLNCMHQIMDDFESDLKRKRKKKT